MWLKARRWGALTINRMSEPVLELEDIQSGVLRPRPSPYVATYVLLRLDEREAGRELMRRLSAVVTSAAQPETPARDTWVSVALTFQGLKTLGVPPTSLNTFSSQFQQGMLARAAFLGDTGESGPEHWEKPLGSADVHVVVTALSPDSQHLEVAMERARKAYQELRGITAIWRQDCHDSVLVKRYGPRCEIQRAGGFFHCFAFRQELKHLALSSRELLCLVPAAHLLMKHGIIASSNCGGDECFSAQDVPHSGCQFRRSTWVRRLAILYAPF